MIDVVEGGYYSAIKENQLLDGESVALTLEGYGVLICKFEGEFYAFKNSCPHQELPMTNAKVRKGKVICPFHGAQFELSNGKSLGVRTTCSLSTYPVRIQNEIIQVLLHK